MKIIQITDTHLFSDPGKTKDNINHFDTFHQCIALANANQPDLVLATGDFVNDIDETAYQHVVEGFKKFNCPCHYILGNHDEDQALAKRCLVGKNISSEQHIVLAHWQIILLNTRRDHAIAGYLDNEELSFLENCLETCNKPALIALHHNPVDINNSAYKSISLTNPQALFDILIQHPQVTLGIYGHVHQAYESEIHGIPFYSTPSTCKQNTPNVTGFIRDKLAPGIREINLLPDGSYNTRIVRVEHEAT